MDYLIFFTLINNNAFGNKIRFTDELGTEIFANSYVVDNYTGLGWKQDAEVGSSQWDARIDSAVSLTFAGFSDWFLPNINQLFSISDKSGTNPIQYSPFNITSTLLASSTTPGGLTTSVLYMTTRAVIDTRSKTGNSNAVFCRKHF